MSYSAVLELDLVVACDMQRGIGKDNRLPWRLKGDMKFFRELTSSNAAGESAVILGRKTWESIPDKNRPLPGRLNVLLTRNKEYPVPPSVIVCHSLDEAIEVLSARQIARCFVIGGADVYAKALAHPQVSTIHSSVTRFFLSSRAPFNWWKKVRRYLRTGWNTNSVSTPRSTKTRTAEVRCL